MNRTLAETVIGRSRGLCEAGCGGRAEHIHHALPRSRGGNILDREADHADKAGMFDAERHAAHLKHLCARCHSLAHGNPQWARSVGLTVQGYVMTGLHGRPVYSGPSWLFRELWGDDEGEAA